MTFITPRIVPKVDFPAAIPPKIDIIAPMSMFSKTILLQALKADLQARLTDAQAALDATRASQENETKSSAGDKYETGRAMLQIELQKLADQRDKIEAQLLVLDKVDAHRVSTVVEFGSLVETDKEWYFVGIGLGRVLHDGKAGFAISLDSPIGQAMRGKKAGEIVHFQGREIQIRAIL